MVAGLVCVSSVGAQHLNQLRDPASTVFAAFPEASSFRAIVRDVDQEAREFVEERLPFKVHFNELGPHAVYVAFRGRKPLGMLYLRTEEGEWGLTEIGWSLTLDLRVIDFGFQRGRSRHRSTLPDSPFARCLAGKDYADLEELLAELEAGSREGIPEGAAELAGTVVRSGMKTLLVIDAVWREELAKLQDLAMGFDAFPGAERFRRQVLRFDEKEAGALAAVHVMRAHGKGGAPLGLVARTEVRGDRGTATWRWLLTRENRILRVVADDGDAQLGAKRSQLEGDDLFGVQAQGDPVTAAAAELAQVLAGFHRREGSE